MKEVNLKSIVLVELLILASIALFSIDLLPKNYMEYQGICSRTWEKDPKQYDICMEPYFRQINLDKYVVVGGIIFLVLIPVFYIHKKRSRN